MLTTCSAIWLNIPISIFFKKASSKVSTASSPLDASSLMIRIWPADFALVEAC